jgi:membrane protein implicated in regulation of membrane protease activity
VILVLALVLAFFVLSPPWSYLAVIAAAIVETAEAALFVWWTKRRRPAVGAEALVGRLAEAVSPLRPVGRVRLDGELWSARCDAGAEPGDAVRVVGLDGLVLAVERA